ncbi:MAG: hypothetical protein ACRDMH_04840 [Solirubrobacterales bacterium]
MTAVLLLLAAAPSASASIEFVRQWGTNGSGNGQFNGPLGIATDTSGNVYVADAFNSRVEKFDSSGTYLTQWGGHGTGPGQFSFPIGVATDSSNDVYVVDGGGPSPRVEKFDSSGNYLTQWSGPGPFDAPQGIATDSSDNVYVGDYDGSDIQKFDSSGGFITSWDNSGSRSSGFYPMGVGTDSSDNVYVTDASDEDSRVERFDSSGNFLDEWADTDDNGYWGVATDSSGNVYVSDLLRSRIVKFDSSGTFLAEWGSFGTGQGQFEDPYFIAIHADNVYVSDGNNHRIQEFHLGRNPPDTTITGGPTGTTNDPTPTFSFSSPDPDTSFQCRVDSGSFAPCESPYTTSPSHLSDGSHTFYARAIDPGATDPTPAARTFTVKTTSVSVSGNILVVTAVPGAADNVAIHHPHPGTLRVTDLPGEGYGGSAIHVGPGCVLMPAEHGPEAARCRAFGVTRIRVSAGDQSDRVTNGTNIVSFLFGGIGSDTLLGGSNADTLTGGPGPDAMMGRNGNDQLHARDLTSDASINCDGGNAPGSADKADLDELPKDPNSVVQGCETKTRH